MWKYSDSSVIPGILVAFERLKVSVFYQFDHDEFIWGPLGPL